MYFKIINILKLILFSLIISVVYADEIITLDTRDNVKQSFLLLEPLNNINGVVIMFPGYKGIIHLSQNGDKFKVEHDGGGFTVDKITRNTYKRNGIVVALVTHPTDKTNGMSTKFRSSDKHLEDIQVVIKYLKNRYKLDPYLHGQCRSTFSPASIATKLKNKGISGIILSSTRSKGKHGSVMDYESGIITLPILLVQHKYDPRKPTLYKNLYKVENFYKQSSNKVDVMIVDGGKHDDGAHSYKGIQKQTAQEISNWITRKEFKTIISD